MTEKIFHMDATHIATLVANREISPVEVVQAHLDRIAEVNPKVNAIVTLADGALGAAKKAEAAVMSGAQVGPLHGVPFTAKDAIDAAGPYAARFADLQGAGCRCRCHGCSQAESCRRHPHRKDEYA
jgi:aspartyl-tRNA(Asn)/glutamyl-tRNA(Gln) amidotransferase subunit A